MCHKFEIIGHAPGLAFGLLQGIGVNWALGRVLTPLLLLGLLHLVHDLLGCGFYTYAIAMRNT